MKASNSRGLKRITQNSTAAKNTQRCAFKISPQKETHLTVEKPFPFLTRKLWQLQNTAIN